MSGHRPEVRFDERRASLWREEQLGGVMGKHDLGVEQAGIRVNKRVGGLGSRRLFHEMTDGQNPCLRDGLVILRSVDAVAPKERQQGNTHARSSLIRTVLRQVDVRCANVGAVIELTGLASRGFEISDETQIFRRYIVTHDHTNVRIPVMPITDSGPSRTRESESERSDAGRI